MLKSVILLLLLLMVVDVVQESLHTRVARLHQRACLVRLAALDLHCADPAVQSDDASCKHLLRAFFLPFDAESDSGETLPVHTALLIC